jgi:hypothetical protein
MKLLGDVGLVESRFGRFGYSVSVGAREVHCWCPTYQRHGNHFGRTQWYSYVTRLKCVLVSFRLEIVLIFTQDRCTICAKQTIGSEIILDAPDGTPR